MWNKTLVNKYLKLKMRECFYELRGSYFEYEFYDGNTEVTYHSDDIAMAILDRLEEGKPTEIAVRRYSHGKWSIYYKESCYVSIHPDLETKARELIKADTPCGFSGRRRDFQRAKVYKFERVSFSRVKLSQWYDYCMSQDEIKKFVGELATEYDVDVPKLIFKDGKKNWADRLCWEIKLSKYGQTKSVLLHEFAHLLTPHDVGHGVQFVGCLMELYDKYIPEQSIENMCHVADKLGVKYELDWRNMYE